jgi:hypothetical protein
MYPIPASDVRYALPKVELNTKISSKYTIKKESINGHNTSFIRCIKVVGALHKPK